MHLRVRRARIVRLMPATLVFYARVLHRQLSNELLESGDGLEVVYDLEPSAYDGLEKVIFGTDLGGDHQDATPRGTGDKIEGAGLGRGKAAFNA